jgi:hypothetical protein
MSTPEASLSTNATSSIASPSAKERQHPAQYAERKATLSLTLTLKTGT